VFDKAALIVKAVENQIAPDCNNNPGGTCKQARTLQGGLRWIYQI